LSSWYYLFGINAGPTYLNGISSEGVPQNINILILLGNLCLLLILVFFGLIVFKSKKTLFKKYLNNFILFFSFIISTLIAALGMFLFGVYLDPRAGALSIIIPLSVFASGMGLAMAQRTNAIASTVPPEEIGVASSVLALARNIAGAFGIAVFATLLTNTIGTNILKIAQYSVVNSASPIVHAQAAALIILKAQVSAYVTVFNSAAILVLFGAVISLFLKISDDTKKVHIEG